MGLAFFVCHIFYGDVGGGDKWRGGNGMGEKLVRLGLFEGAMKKWWVSYGVCDKWSKMEWFSPSVVFCVYRSEAQRVRPSVVRHNL